MQVEDIIAYINKHEAEYLFTIREYASPMGDYSNEAVIFYPIVSDTVGIIIEQDPFSPALSYTQNQVSATFQRLTEKSVRIATELEAATQYYNHKTQI